MRSRWNDHASKLTEASRVSCSEINTQSSVYVRLRHVPKPLKGKSSLKLVHCLMVLIHRDLRSLGEEKWWHATIQQEKSLTIRSCWCFEEYTDQPESSLMIRSCWAVSVQWCLLRRQRWLPVPSSVLGSITVTRYWLVCQMLTLKSWNVFSTH